MLEQLMQLIKQSGQQAVVENTEVPNEHNSAILDEAQQSITSGLQGLASTGELNDLMDTNDETQVAAHPAVQNISNNFIGNIMEKFGLNKGTAAAIAASVIPMVLSKIMNKGNNPQNGGGFDLGGLLSSLTTKGTQSGEASGGGGLMDNLSNIGVKMGLDKDGDGDVDLNDLSKLIK